MIQDTRLEELAHIRGLMDRSTRFLSLSGLSGVVAGSAALVGAFLARPHHRAIGAHDRLERFGSGAYRLDDRLADSSHWEHLCFLAVDGASVLVVALMAAWYFTRRRGQRTGQGIWDASARRMLTALLVPLVAGGIFCIALVWHNDAFLVAPVTLVFYGLALVNASKYTLVEVRWLGLSELVLGLSGLFWPGVGLLLWALGFGVLHIAYGGLMYLRHERE
ncbi:MAG: hypothetical protein KDC03_23940 [Flavobacteriales bacterium]|nr:hypothetical protein [Flavobacteriales bacterium]